MTFNTVGSGTSLSAYVSALLDNRCHLSSGQIRRCEQRCIALYTSLMQQQDTTPAVFSVPSTTSALTYPGVLASKA